MCLLQKHCSGTHVAGSHVLLPFVLRAVMLQHGECCSTALSVSNLTTTYGMSMSRCGSQVNDQHITKMTIMICMTTVASMPFHVCSRSGKELNNAGSCLFCRGNHDCLHVTHS